MRWTEGKATMTGGRIDELRIFADLGHFSISGEIVGQLTALPRS